MTDLIRLILGILASRFKARATPEAENLVLRQQVNVLRRRTPKRPHLNNTDRFLFVWLYRWFPTAPKVSQSPRLPPSSLGSRSASGPTPINNLPNDRFTPPWAAIPIKLAFYRYCRKSRKSNDAKNLAKVDF